MPLPLLLARRLAEWGHEAVHASDIGLDRAPDEAILQQAKSDGRTVVTADLDYPRLLALAGAAEPSLVLFRGGNWSDAEVIGKMDSLLRSIGEQAISESIV